MADAARGINSGSAAWSCPVCVDSCSGQVGLSRPRSRVADFACDFAKRKSSGERVVVGVNKYVDEGEDQKVEVHKVDPGSERRQIDRLVELKRTRDNDEVRRRLYHLLEVARDPEANVMPATIEAVKAHGSSEGRVRPGSRGRGAGRRCATAGSPGPRA
jgi:methylmalonyl-CoA mutase N-terminal domain/subunit